MFHPVGSFDGDGNDGVGMGTVVVDVHTVVVVEERGGGIDDGGGGELAVMCYSICDSCVDSR